ncbi:hypothetical protein FB645_002453 [Coemansia sp. IMI 203386]|nr:hypothetical protein FB645_002453 [Coemansia sp. IMI 203386]
MSQPAVQINQIDLLSGISTVLVIVAGIVQIWPSPSQVYQKHLEDFMDWLKTNIEKDFCMSIYFCEKKCMTQLYDSSLDLIEKRIRMDIGEIKEVGCPSSPHILKPEEQMAELARHQVISDHIPWVRYGIYYLVASLAGKQLSTRTWKIDETAAKEKDKDCTVIENGIVKSGFNEHVSAFNHVMINERRLTMKIAGDECSAARLLYSIALHSLQVILLCNTFGYPPPHKLIGSFIGAQHDLKETMILFRHAQLDSVFKHLYGWTLDRSSVADARGLLFYTIIAARFRCGAIGARESAT